MSTSDYELHRAIVHSSNTLTGAAKVRIPSLLSAGDLVDIPTTGLTRTAGEMGDEWNVPAKGSSVFVAVSTDRTQFLWVTALSTPTDGPTTFEGSIISNSEVVANGGVSASNYISLLNAYDDPYISLTKEGEGTAWIRKSTGYVSINALSDDETTVQDIVLDGNVGIGTTNPSAELDVNGTGRFTEGVALNRSYTTSSIFINDRTYCGDYVLMNSTATRTVTTSLVTAGTFNQGDQITFIRQNTGAVNFVAGSGTAIYSRNGDLSIAYRYSAATLICDSTDGSVWYLVGDLT